MNIDSTKVTFVSRKESKTREDLVKYQYDTNTVSIVEIPLGGHMTFKVQRGRGLVEGSQVSTYENTWPVYNVPPRYKPLLAAMLRYYEANLEEHNERTCTTETLCHICLLRKYQRGPNAVLLDKILIKKAYTDTV